MMTQTYKWVFDLSLQVNVELRTLSSEMERK